jgi:THUMP domain-like
VSDCIEITDYEWLVGSEAAAVLADLAGRGEPLHIAASRLRRQFSAARVHLLLEQIELRRRAAAKFAHPNQMFFTPLGLEQATDGWVASYKAQRFAGRGPIADLCCGIGGDLLAVAGQGITVGVDRDPIAACLATANAGAILPQNAAAGVSLAICEADQFALAGYGAWHLDPDRRPQGNRTTSLEWSCPDQTAVERLLTESPNAAIKLAPAADVPPAWTDRCELEWISRNRECRQLVAWHGELARSPGVRRATILSNDGAPRRTVTGQPNVGVRIAERLGGFLFEPDAAVLAAHLTGSLAAEHGLERVSAGVAYLTSDAASDDLALTCFEIEDILPFETRRLATHLHDLQIGSLEIKKRGVEVDPSQLRRQLKLRGDHAATLILTPHAGKQIAILAYRSPATSPTSDLRPLASSHATGL